MGIRKFTNYENNLKGIEIQTKKSIIRMGFNLYSFKTIKRYLPITNNKFIFIKDYIKQSTMSRTIEFRFLIFQVAVKFI